MDRLGGVKKIGGHGVKGEDEQDLNEGNVQMNGMKQRIAAGVLGLVTAAGIGTAGTASAADKIWDENVRIHTVLTQIDNPCTPEFDDITLDADWHSVVKYWLDNDGAWRYRGSTRAQLAGTAADGTSYVANLHYVGSSQTEDGVIEQNIDEHHLLVSQGSAPNFTLRLKMHIRLYFDGTPAEYDIVKDGTDCRG